MSALLRDRNALADRRVRRTRTPAGISAVWAAVATVRGRRQTCGNSGEAGRASREADVLTLILAAAQAACGSATDALPKPLKKELRAATALSPCKVAELPAPVRAKVAQLLRQETLSMADPGE